MNGLMPQSGAKSLLLIDEKQANDLRVAPIVGADITLERWWPRNRPAPKDAAQSRLQMKSDERGYFSGGIAVRPGRCDVALSVSAHGFRSAEKSFRHDRPMHAIHVLRARKIGFLRPVIDHPGLFRAARLRVTTSMRQSPK